MKNLVSGKFIILWSCIAMLISWQARADAVTEQQDTTPKIAFQATTESVVQEDKVQVVLNSQLQTSKLSKKQSQLLEQRVETLIQQLGQYKAIKVVENYRNSFANYNNQGKVTGWTLQATITLESGDFTQIAEFISDLPDNFNLSATNFFVSPEKRKQQEAEMLTTLLAEIQQKAEVIRKELHREQYRIVNINIARDRAGYMLAREAPMSLAKANVQQEADNSGLSFTPGETRLMMSADVVISLSEK